MESAEKSRGRLHGKMAGKKQAGLKQVSPQHTMAASLTAEAAIVMSIVLLSVMELILFDFRLHDEIAASNALICVVEMYSHRNGNSAWAEDYRKTAEDTGIYITGDGQKVSLQTGKLPYSITGTVSCRENSRTFTNSHIRPEALLRAATLTGLLEE